MAACKHCGRPSGSADTCPACAELDCSWPPQRTSEQVLRALAAGYLVELEQVGRDFAPAECPVCLGVRRTYQVAGDRHRTLFEFGVVGAYRHQCFAAPPAGDHPAWTARERQHRDQQQLLGART